MIYIYIGRLPPAAPAEWSLTEKTMNVFERLKDAKKNSDCIFLYYHIKLIAA